MYDPEGKEIDHEVEMSYTGSLSRTNIHWIMVILFIFHWLPKTVRFDLSDYKQLVIGQVKLDNLSIMEVQLRNK